MDAAHVLMGVAMAGMLESRLSVLPGVVWQAAFGAGAAWFGWQVLRARGPRSRSDSGCGFPLPHLIECLAMIYMLLPGGTSARFPRAPGMKMPGMAASGLAGPYPAIAILLALFMVGYVVWTTDGLTHARAAAPDRGGVPARPALLARPARPARSGPRGQSLVLAPSLTAYYKIAMGITMGYMLILMA